MQNHSLFVGNWIGTYTLWFEPGEPAGVSETELTGNFDEVRDAVTLRYEWTFNDESHKGMYLIGNDASVAFTDTFHYGGGLMLCRPDEHDALDASRRGAIGTWEHEGQAWGWRTTFETPSDDELVVTAWLVTPEGNETKASEAAYKRVQNGKAT